MWQLTLLSNFLVENPMDVVTPAILRGRVDRWNPGTVGYEPFSNREWSQRATNNASEISALSRKSLWVSWAVVGNNFLSNSGVKPG